MPLLNKEDKRKELEVICDFLNNLEFPAAILPEGPWAEESSLLVELPIEEEVDWNGEEFPEDAPIAAAHILQLSEEEKQLTKYLVFYFMLPEGIGEDKEAEALKLVNTMNQQIRMGSFFYGESQGKNGLENHIQYRLSIGVSTDEMWDEGVVGEALIEMGLYYDLMQEEISKRNLQA